MRVFLVLLLSLWLRGSEAQGVDQNTLARIISNIQNRYHPLHGEQYAVAFTVPAASCGAGFTPGENFPPGNIPADVREAFDNRELYQKNGMIGAVPRGNAHAESRLLNARPPNVPPMQNLLNHNQGCVIFYSYYSPCDATCLNPKSPYNILTALQMFHGHPEPKAFVYNQPFHGAKGVRDHGRDIDNNVGLYRCFSNNGHYECHHCFQNGQLAQVCLE